MQALCALVAATAQLHQWPRGLHLESKRMRIAACSVAVTFALCLLQL